MEGYHEEQYSILRLFTIFTMKEPLESRKRKSCRFVSLREEIVLVKNAAIQGEEVAKGINTLTSVCVTASVCP